MQFFDTKISLRIKRQFFLRNFRILLHFSNKKFDEIAHDEIAQAKAMDLSAHFS